jgi:hypothetical protein
MKMTRREWFSTLLSILFGSSVPKPKVWDKVPVSLLKKYFPPIGAHPIVGYRGATKVDGGYYYAPYIPLQ